MLKHMFKLVWNKKKSNALLILEIFISFLVLFAVVSFGTYYLTNYQQPLGFSYKNVIVVNTDNRKSGNDQWSDDQIEMMRQLGNGIAEFPQVVSYSSGRNIPYIQGDYMSNTSINNRTVNFSFDEVTDGFDEVMNIPIHEGRWFNASDDADTVHRAVVITENLSRAVFGDSSAVGRLIDDNNYKIVGVVSAYKKKGEFADNLNFMFKRVSLTGNRNRPPDSFVIKLADGTPIEFEEQLVRKLQSIAKDWIIEAEWMTDMRDNNTKTTMIPVYILGTIALFLILMVTLGLLGVLWQNVTRRTSEIGLRRAMGATVGKIHYQIIGELLFVASLGILIALLLIIQIPILGIMPFLSTTVITISIAVSCVVIFGMVFLSSWYPSHIATSIAPVDALRFE